MIEFEFDCAVADGAFVVVVVVVAAAAAEVAPSIESVPQR